MIRKIKIDINKKRIKKNKKEWLKLTQDIKEEKYIA